jgi:hypothetical protein
MIVPLQLALKTHTNFGCVASFATLDKLVDRFLLPPVAPPIGDTSLTHIMRLAAHSTTSPTPTAVGQSFIMTLYIKLVSRKYILRTDVKPIHDFIRLYFSLTNVRLTFFENL